MQTLLVKNVYNVLNTVINSKFYDICLTELTVFMFNIIIYIMMNINQ